MEHSIHRGSGNRKEDSQASWFVGFEGETSSQSQGVLAEHSYRLF